MEMPGRDTIFKTGYRYGFNGKEKDSNITKQDYDYGFRIYDARVGKFLSVDPMTNKYPELTPYQFASNRPIDGIDQDGLEYLGVNNTNIRSTVKNKDGSYTLSIGDQTVKASNIVSYNGNDYYNIGQNLYSTAKGIKTSGNANQKITEFFVTPAQLQAIFPKGNASALNTLGNTLNQYMSEYGIEDYKALAHLLAQAGVETGGFTTLNATENLNYTRNNVCSIIAPHNAAVDANPDPYVQNPQAVGDLRYEGGYDYRGRGILQLTHLSNYKKFQQNYNSKYTPAIDVVSSPDLIATNQNLSIISGLDYFYYRVVKKGIDLSGTSNTTVDKVTLQINGGYRQRYERRKLFNDALGALH
jgi:RHS repeat-associated protein